MKLNIVLASLCLIGAYGYVTAMDYKRDAYLKFKLNKDLQVIDSKAKQMDFFLPPSDFTGKVITEAVPKLSPEDLAALNNGFQKACTGKKKEKVPYTLKERHFIAAIKYKHKKDGFSVKVREAGPAEKK